jgi:hypothetical protein
MLSEAKHLHIPPRRSFAIAQDDTGQNHCVAALDVLIRSNLNKRVKFQAAEASFA